jgi:hypothetical protein
VWTIPAGATVTAGGTSLSNSVTITWNSIGTKVIKVTYTNSNGCTAIAATQKTVTVSPTPVPVITGPNSCCKNTNVTFSTIPFQSNYFWTTDAGGIIVSGQGTKTVVVSWSSVGSHTISLNYTNANGCSALTPTVRSVVVNSCKSDLIEPDSTGNINPINSITLGSEIVDLTIYPNPNGGSFTVSYTAPEPDTYNLQVFSNLGVLVYELRDLQVNGTMKQEVDIRGVAPGVYNCILTNKNRSIHKMVIIR